MGVAHGAEDETGDVGESGGTAGGDVSAGQEFIEGGEGVVNVLRLLELLVLGSEDGGIIAGVGELGGGVAWAVRGCGVEDEQGALATGGGAVLAALEFGRRVSGWWVHERSFLE